ncbi:hypothetical protein FRC18_006570 [Serendipita sp. 400]|nr:hypothetical protein FRC18_006570 [Serendipita sp. 400]
MKTADGRRKAVKGYKVGNRHRRTDRHVSVAISDSSSSSSSHYSSSGLFTLFFFFFFCLRFSSLLPYLVSDTISLVQIGKKVVQYSRTLFQSGKTVICTLLLSLHQPYMVIPFTSKILALQKK